MLDFVSCYQQKNLLRNLINRNENHKFGHYLQAEIIFAKYAKGLLTL